MKQITKNLNILSLTMALLLFITISYIWYNQCKTTLIDLQKKILAAKTEDERHKIVDQLDKYYLSMSIPDSIQQRVQSEVDTLIKLLETGDLDTNFAIIDTNVYVLENQLKDVLRNAMIARICGYKQMLQALIKHAKMLANTVDIGTDNSYWCVWVTEVESFNADKAMIWLMADRAERLCTRYHLTAYADAEKYASYGLQLLQQVKDARLRLDITQRLLIILRRFRCMYDLSYPFAQREIKKADEIKYYLRANGLLFHYATTLWLAGQNHLALKNFLKMIERVEKYSIVPHISWYKKSGYLGTAKANWQLGDYDKVLSICDEVETFELDYFQKIELHNTRGMAHRNLGNYDNAEQEYNKALDIAVRSKDITNQIYVLQNLGTMCFRLTEYDKAISYYNKAMTLIQENCPQYIESRSGLLICYAEVKAAQNEIESYNHQIQQANDLIQLINLPSVKAELLRSIGRLNMKMQKYQQAYNNFEKSTMIYEDCGLLRAALETKINVVECLISLSKLKEAQNLSNEIYILATDIRDAQRKIDAIGLMAEIAWNNGNIDKAIQKSNQLIKAIESLSTLFSNVDNLTGFRQKIHNYLQNAVIYELKKGRLDSSFIKLDYIKARAAKNRLNMSSCHTSNSNDTSNFVDIEALKTQLNEKELVVNYFVTPDTVYAFVVDQENIKLLKTAIKIEELKNMVNTYIHSIHKTVAVFHDCQSDIFSTHYDSVIAVSKGLYKILFGWPDLQVRLQNTEVTYIIPDDFLFRIPFSSLTNSGEKETQFLIQQTAIVNLLGAAFLQSQRDGDVKHDFNNKRVLISVDRRLPGTDELVDCLKKRFPYAEELIIDKPDIKEEDILLKLNQGYAIYIFLGHSAANTKLPDLSFFELTAISRADLSPTTIKISLADLKNIDWCHAEMVFLIGCETAKGKTYRGTGLASIQQGILTCGAKKVLASLWKIDANQTNYQIINFLKSWKEKMCPAIALQDIQIKKIQSLQNDKYYKKPHPYFWGSLTLSQSLTY